MRQLLHMNGDDVRRIEFFPDGSRFLVVGRDDVASYFLDGTMDGTLIEPIVFFDAAYVGNDRIVASPVIEDKLPERVETLTLYNLNTGQKISQIVTNDIRSICVDFKRERILAGSLGDSGGYIETYDFALKRLSQFASEKMPFDMVISHSGNHVAVASTFFELWDTTDDPYPRFQDYPPDDDYCTGYICEVNAVDITPDGRYALGGLYGGKSACFVVDVVTGVITGWYGPDGTAKYIDTATAALSPDGKYAAIAIRNAPTVDIYRVSDNTLFYQFEASGCQAIAFSPKGNLLVLGGMNYVSLWRFVG